MNAQEFNEYVTTNDISMENLDEKIETKEKGFRTFDFLIRESYTLSNGEYAVSEYEIIDFKQTSDDLNQELYEYQTDTTFDEEFTIFKNKSEVQEFMNK